MKILSKSTDIAKAVNFEKYPVLIYNTDEQKGSKVVVTHNSRRHGCMRYKCTLEMGYQTENDGVMYIATRASCIKSHYGWSDHLEDAEYANAPALKDNQVVAVLMYSPKANTSFIRMMKTGKIDSLCQVATMLKDIEDEEVK